MLLRPLRGLALGVKVTPPDLLDALGYMLTGCHQRSAALHSSTRPLQDGLSEVLEEWPLRVEPLRSGGVASRLSTDLLKERIQHLPRALGPGLLGHGPSEARRLSRSDRALLYGGAAEVHRYPEA